MANVQENTMSRQVGLRDGEAEYLTVTIGSQVFCIPVLQIQDVLGRQDITRIPLSPPEIAGSLNLRGRVVTAIDVRKLLGMAPSSDSRDMNVVVEHDGELYSLIVDTVSIVQSVPMAQLESNPATLEPALRSVSAGVFRMEDSLVLVMDVARLLESGFDS